MNTLRLGSLFQNHAVLQRNQTIPVWGWATPRSRITATLSDSTAYTYANELGRFEVRLPAMEAGGPFTLSVKDEESGEQVEVTDILIGEVWVGSGQSNMEWTMRACGETVAADVDAANYPNLRYYRVEEAYALGEHDLAGGEWLSVTSKSVMNCSAVAYSFARSLHTELDVPIGIIVSARGGTIIESWTSRSGLMANPETRQSTIKYDIDCHAPKRWEQSDERGGEQYSRYPEDPGNLAYDQGWGALDFQDSEWDSMELPNTWQSQGHEYSGVFWFRKHVTIPKEWVGRSLSLNLGSIDKHDVTYVNGVEVGRVGKGLEVHHWTELRSYEVPSDQIKSTEVTIAVRVNSFVYDGGMRGPSSRMSLHLSDDASQSVSLAGEWLYAIEHNFGYVETVSEPGHNEPNSPHILFDNMIAPLIPYAIRGVIWYQGESNAHLGVDYLGRLKTLINDWRYLWGQGDFAFYTVQLPDYLGKELYQDTSTWAGVRQAQLESLQLENTGIAITLGLGEFDDIHPTNKMPVGERLAQNAMVHIHGYDAEPCGPLFESYSINGSEIVCSFRNCADGLATQDSEAPVGVYVAGTDRKFIAAKATLKGNQLTVSHPSILEPKAVRYAWADNPELYNLCNSAGQIASPFRTDDW